MILTNIHVICSVRKPGKQKKKQEGHEALNCSPESKPLWDWSNQAKDPADYGYFKVPRQPKSITNFHEKKQTNFKPLNPWILWMQSGPTWPCKVSALSTPIGLLRNWFFDFFFLLFVFLSHFSFFGCHGNHSNWKVGIKII